MKIGDLVRLNKATRDFLVRPGAKSVRDYVDQVGVITDFPTNDSRDLATVMFPGTTRRIVRWTLEVVNES